MLLKEQHVMRGIFPERDFVLKAKRCQMELSLDSLPEINYSLTRPKYS